MELFATPFHIFWDSAELGALEWKYIPTLMQTNSHLLSSKDLEFIIGMSKSDLPSVAAKTLANCLCVAARYCPSYKPRITQALKDLSHYPKRESIRATAAKCLASVSGIYREI